METGAAPLNGHRSHDGERAYIASCGMVSCLGRAGAGDLQGWLRKGAANLRAGREEDALQTAVMLQWGDRWCGGARKESRGKQRGQG